MPHIDLERLVLNYSYHLVLCILFFIRVSVGSYSSKSSLQSILKSKINLVNSLRYKLRRKS